MSDQPPTRNAAVAALSDRFTNLQRAMQRANSRFTNPALIAQIEEMRAKLNAHFNGDMIVNNWDNTADGLMKQAEALLAKTKDQSFSAKLFYFLKSWTR